MPKIGARSALKIGRRAEPFVARQPYSVRVDALFFDTAADRRAWFEANHDSAPELFVGDRKKGSGRSGVSHPEAIGQALCFGWIDSVSRSLDEQRYRARFTPRRKGSVWSSIYYRRAATHWVISAKRPETRERRPAQLIADSGAGRRCHRSP